jgi:hypothetical protein
MSKTKDRDFFVTARRVVEQAIGEHVDGTPLEVPEVSKNLTAARSGSLGGKKGGKARAEKLTAAERSQIARKAARTRWSVKKSTSS